MDKSRFFVVLCFIGGLLLSACGGEGETAVSFNSPTPTLTAVSTSTPTPTSTQTATPTSTPTEEPTVTASATASPTMTPTPRPSATPKPTTPPEPTSTWDRYQVRTLQNLRELTDPLLALLDEAPAQYPSIYLEFSEEYQYPSRVQVLYTGQFREIAPERQFAIARWAEAFLPNLADKYIPLFQHEVLVREGSDEYWMPVQEPLIPYMENELLVDGKATMFVVWIGALLPGPEEVDRIYLINEFRQ